MRKVIDKSELYDLYVIKGLTMKEVSAILGVGVGTIHRHIHSENIEPRKQEKAWNSGLTYEDDGRILAKENHPRYIDGRTYPSDFFKMREILLPAVCDICGEDAECLHHLDMDIHNNHKDNLQPLCKSCHTILHNKDRKSYIKLLEGRGIKTN